MSAVLMYTTGTCSYCKRAKVLLGQYGVIPAEIRVDTDPAKWAEMVGRTGNMRTVPQIFIGNRHVGGYDQLIQLHEQKLLGAMLTA